jgi:hypothetical protein
VLASPRLDGRKHPSGGTFSVKPDGDKVNFQAVCVDGVVLSVRTVSGRLLASRTCSSGGNPINDVLRFEVRLSDVTGPGAGPADPVTLMVERTGLDTDQWIIQ